MCFFSQVKTCKLDQKSKCLFPSIFQTTSWICIPKIENLILKLETKVKVVLNKQLLEQKLFFFGIKPFFFIYLKIK